MPPPIRRLPAIAANPAAACGAGDCVRCGRRRWRGPGSSSWCWISGPVRSASNSAMPIIWRSRSASLVAFAAARGAPRPVLLAGFAVLLLAALANAWLGAYHAGVEWQFWQGPTDCSGPVVNLGSAGNAAGAPRHRKGGPLRRGAVALPRPLARRLQRADLALDGADRAVGYRVDETSVVSLGGQSGYRLCRFVCNDEVALQVRQSNPTGKSTKVCPVPSRKNIPLNPSGKSKLECRHPVPPEGRRPSSRTLGQVAVDADAMSDECGVKRTAKSCGPDAAVLASSS